MKPSEVKKLKTLTSLKDLRYIRDKVKSTDAEFIRRPKIDSTHRALPNGVVKGNFSGRLRQKKQERPLELEDQVLPQKKSRQGRGKSYTSPSKSQGPVGNRTSINPDFLSASPSEWCVKSEEGDIIGYHENVGIAFLAAKYLNAGSKVRYYATRSE